MNHLDIVAAHYAAARRGDLPTAVEHFATDIVWVEGVGSPTPGTFVGSEAVVDGVFLPALRTWEHLHIDVDELLECGNKIIAVGTYRGVLRGPSLPVSARTVHVWDLLDGAVVGFEEITDAAGALQAVAA